MVKKLIYKNVINSNKNNLKNNKAEMEITNYKKIMNLLILK